MGVVFIADVEPVVMQHELVSSTMQVVIPQRSIITEPQAPAVEETVLAPSRGWIAVNWRELIRGRELLYFLVWRDVKVRYKQAVLGVAWVVLQPLFNMIMFTVVFGHVANFSAKMGERWGHAYALYVFVAMLPWQIVSTGLSNGGMSLLNQTHLLTKIYFPRLYVPTSVVGGALFDFVISSLFVVVLMLWYHVAPSAWVIAMPLLLVLTLACSAGAAYLFSALTITYRDFRFLIPFIGQVWMWGSFVAFPPSVFGTLGFKTRIILSLNPMYGIITAWRKLLLGGAPDSITGFEPMMLVSSIVVTAAFFLLGLFYFRRTERRFADIA
jgi:lipopolysaccharide transport system permease protein